MQQFFYENYGAKVTYNELPDQGHDLPNDIEQKLLKYLLENLSHTGFDPVSKHLKPADIEITAEKSRFMRFD